MAKIQFPLQFERQYSNPIDIDMVFETTSILNSYLTDNKRYAGMIVTCKEQEGKIFVLNNDKDEWLTFDSSLYEKTANKVTSFNTPTDTEYPSAKLVKEYVDSKVSTVYKPQGSVLFSSLVVGLLVAANSGFVYNITDAFTTNENFVEGVGKSHSAGTNVVIIEHSGNYKFDVLGGTVDLTPYELLSNKVIAWSSTTNDTRYASEKLVKDSLDELENTVQGVSDLSPYHYEGTFVGGDLSQNDFDNLIVAFEDLREGTEFNETKLQGSYFVCSADSSFYFNTTYHWSAAEGTGKTSAITYTWAAPYDLNGLTEINMKAGDIISILDFSYDAGSNTISTLVKVEKSLDTKADKVIPASTGNIPKLNASGNLEDSGFTLEKSVPSNAVFTDTVYTLPQASTNTRGGIKADTKQATDTVEVKIDVASEKLYAPTYPTIPTVPTISIDITTDATSDIKTASPKAVKTYVDNIVGDIETLLEAI